MPWKTEPVVTDTTSCHHHHLEKKIVFDGENDYDCPALHGEGVVGGAGAGSSFKQEAAVAGESEIDHGSSTTCSHSSSRAAGNWRNEASVRFMRMWKDFLDHEDAPLDSQYDTVRQIYAQLVGRLGADAPINNRKLE